MKTVIPSIPLREALHFLGWRGGAIDERVQQQINDAVDAVKSELEAHVIIKRFTLADDMRLEPSIFVPKGNDIRRLLENCEEAILMAAPRGAQSERLLLR